MDDLCEDSARKIILSAELDFGLKYAPSQKGDIRRCQPGSAYSYPDPEPETTVIRGLIRIFDRMGA